MDHQPEDLIPPSEIARFFKNPALLATETLREYDSLFRGIALNVDPQNNLEWLSLGNYHYSQWQIRRVQNAICCVVNAAHCPALQAILEAILPKTKDRQKIAARMTSKWYENPGERTATLELLRQHGLDENSITARAMELRAAELERLDVQLQRHKLAATRHLRELEAIRRCSFWRSTDEIVRGHKRGQTRPNGNGSHAGAVR
jgi:hypothetical protein